MKIIFEEIFHDLNKTGERNFNEEILLTMSKQNLSGTNDSVGFDFIFDDNGDYSYTGSEHGFGKSVNLRGKIMFPVDGTYSVNIRSSDGGGGQWDGVKANQEVSCVINTSFWHQTTITVYIHSNKPNCRGNAIINYSV